MEKGNAARSDPIIRLRLRPESVVALLGTCVFVVLLFVGSGPPERPSPSPAPSPSPSPNQTTATSADGLRALFASVRQPVYWLGNRPDTKLELTRATRGRIFIRYLPENTPTGDSSLTYPFVATYRYPKAFNAVLKASTRKGSVVRRLARGGLAIQSKPGYELVRSTAQPLPSPPVFFAYPGSDRLIEVYDPSADHALRLVTAGQVRPVR